MLEVRANLDNVLSAIHANPGIDEELRNILTSDQPPLQATWDGLLHDLTGAAIFNYVEEDASARTQWMQTLLREYSQGSIDPTRGMQ